MSCLCSRKILQAHELLGFLFDVLTQFLGQLVTKLSATEGVGKFVLQLAQQYRFKTINAIRRREQESIIRNLGGDEVICTADEDLRSRLQELTAGKGVERAIDCVAGDLCAEIARNLAPAATMLVYGALSSHRQTDPAKLIMPLFAPRLIYSTATVRGCTVRAGLHFPIPIEAQ